MMEYIYYLMESALPFEFIKYDFMKNALLAILIISPLFGLMGTMIVNNKMAFFSDSVRTFCTNWYCNRCYFGNINTYIIYGFICDNIWIMLKQNK